MRNLTSRHSDHSFVLVSLLENDGSRQLAVGSHDDTRQRAVATGIIGIGVGERNSRKSFRGRANVASSELVVEAEQALSSSEQAHS